MEQKPKKYICPYCGAESDRSVCPECGRKFYVPMSEETQRKVRFILTIVCFIVLGVILVIRSI